MVIWFFLCINNCGGCQKTLLRWLFKKEFISLNFLNILGVALLVGKLLIFCFQILREYYPIIF